MGTHLTTHVRTAVAGGVFIISVLALSMAGASAVGSLLHAAPLRSRVALYLAIGVALVALPQLLVPESPVHRASCAVAAAVGFVAGSAIVFALRRVPESFSAREVAVLVVAAPVALAALHYCRRQLRGHEPAKT